MQEKNTILIEHDGDSFMGAPWCWRAYGGDGELVCRGRAMFRWGAILAARRCVKRKYKQELRAQRPLEKMRL